MPSKSLLIVTLGLLSVIFCIARDWIIRDPALSVTPRTTVASLRGKIVPTVGVLVFNFVLVPLVVALTLHAFHFASQATMAFATILVVAGAPFVAMFTKLGHADVAFAAAVSLILILITVVILLILCVEIGHRMKERVPGSAQFHEATLAAAGAGTTRS